VPGWHELALPARHARLLVLAPLGDRLLVLGSVPGPAGRAPAAWTTSDARAWQRVPLRPATGYGRQAQFVMAGVAGTRISAFGQASGGAHGLPRPTLWTGTAAGLVEHEQPFTMFGGEDAISQNYETAGAPGDLIVGAWDQRDGRYGAATWLSTDGGITWRRFADAAGLRSAPGEQTNARAAAPLRTGFLVVGEAQRTGRTTQPLIWTSDDPRSWRRIVLPSGAAGTRDGATAARVTCPPTGSRCYVIGNTTGPHPRLLCWSVTAHGHAQLGSPGGGGGLVEPAQVVVASGRLAVVVDIDHTARLFGVGTDCAGWRQVRLPVRSQDAAVADLRGRLLLATTDPDGSRLWLR
jgi:hypothetical protein